MKGSTTRIDSTPQGEPGNVHAGCPAALTPDATHVVTFTGSTNLVDDDLHGQDNILMFTGYR